MRQDIVDAARRWIGTPYRHQASTLGAGCDCLGLVRGVWREIYGDEPMVLPAYRADWRDARYADELLAVAETLLRRAEDGPRAGQAILFRLGRTRAPKHCGIALGADRFIHAQERLGVIEANLGDSWRRRIAGLYDLPEL
jgi:NlpC/P60 family putative phage cell wall peptidase